MATFKRITGTLSIDTPTVIYTAGSTGAIIIGMVYSHNGSNEAAYGLDVKAAESGGVNPYYILGKNIEVHQKSSFALETKITVEAGETIVAYASPFDHAFTEECIDYHLSVMEF